MEGGVLVATARYREEVWTGKQGSFVYYYDPLLIRGMWLVPA